jgi:hypothetical protein
MKHLDPIRNLMFYQYYVLPALQTTTRFQNIGPAIIEHLKYRLAMLNENLCHTFKQIFEEDALLIIGLIRDKTKTYRLRGRQT